MNQKRNFSYGVKQSAVEPLAIIAPPAEPEQGIHHFSLNTVIASCLHCGSVRPNLVRMPEYCHFEAIRCGKCDTFLGWLSNPKRLQGKKVSPRQQEVTEGIEAKVRGAR